MGVKAEGVKAVGAKAVVEDIVGTCKRSSSSRSTSCREVEAGGKAVERAGSKEVTDQIQATERTPDRELIQGSAFQLGGTFIFSQTNFW